MDVKLIEEKERSLRSRGHAGNRRATARKRVREKVEEYMEKGYVVDGFDYDSEDEEYRVLMTKNDGPSSQIRP